MDYFKALTDTREKEDLNIFRKLMLSHYGKMLNQELEKYSGIKYTTRSGIYVIASDFGSNCAII